MPNDVIRIIGLDPGLRKTGWGIIDSMGNNIKYVAHGVIEVKEKDDLAKRLSKIFTLLSNVVEQWRPEEACVEETFINVNPSSTLKLGQARGIAMVVPALKGLTVAEYAPNKIKKSIVGAGHADKAQVMMMIQHLLPTCGGLTADSADALAAAICHAHYRTTRIAWEVA